MKDLLIGMVVGVVTGYVLRKMEDDGKFRCLHANLHHLASKAKEEAKSAIDSVNMDGLTDEMKSALKSCLLYTSPSPRDTR